MSVKTNESRAAANFDQELGNLDGWQESKSKAGEGSQHGSELKPLPEENEKLQCTQGNFSEASDSYGYATDLLRGQFPIANPILSRPNCLTIANTKFVGRVL